MKSSEMVWLLTEFFSFLKVHGLAEKYTCGSLQRDSSGIITSPNKKTGGIYDSNQRCRWTFVAQENMMIQLHIEEMDIEDHEGCLNDYLAIYDGNDIVGKGYYCGTELPAVVTFHSRVSYLDFVSNDVVNRSGFKAKYVQIKDSDCGYVMTLRAGGLRSLINSRKESNVDCMWMIEKVPSSEILQVPILNMDIQASNHCADDYLMLRGNSMPPARHCGSVPPPVFTTTSKYTFIHFQSHYNSSDSGFTAVYTNSDDGLKCGGIITNSSESIHSVDTDGDSLYDINTECVWILVAPPTHIIELTFLYMDIEWHKNCEWDYIRIFDGLHSYPFDGLIGWYCGQDAPEQLYSKSNVLYVEFISDHDAVFTGFEVVFTHISETNVTSNITTAIVTDPQKADMSGLTSGNDVTYCDINWLLFVVLSTWLKFVKTDSDI